MSNAEIFRAYVARFTSGDREGAAELLTEEFRFHGPMLRSEGKEVFLEGSAGLCQIMCGVEVHRQWEEGDELCSIYDFRIETPVGAVSIPMAELSRDRVQELIADDVAEAA